MIPSDHDRHSVRNDPPASTRLPHARRATPWTTLLGAAVLAGGALTQLPACVASQTTQAQPAKLAAHARIGTYDSRAVAIAYGRSEWVKKSVGQLHEKHRKALAAGDKKLADELSAAGESQQIRLHLQGFSNAPVDDALDKVRDRLPEVARRAGVVALISLADYYDPSVELVDVTDEVVKLFNPDAQTLKIVADCRNQRPLAIEAVARMRANE